MTDQKTWTPCEIATLRDAFIAGQSRAEIARALQRSPGSVRGKILSLGLRRGVRPWTSTDKALLTLLHADDVSIAVIAHRLQRTVDSVTKMCTRLALRRVPPAQAWTDEQLATLNRLLSQGHCLARIAKEVGHPRSSIADKLRKLDLKSGLFRLPWTDDELRVIVSLHAQGIGPAQIAERLPGRTTAAVRIKLRTMGTGPAPIVSEPAPTPMAPAPVSLAAVSRAVAPVAGLSAPSRPRLAVEAQRPVACVIASVAEMERWLRSRDYMVLHTQPSGWIIDRFILTDKDSFVEFVNTRRLRLHLPPFVNSGVEVSAPLSSPVTHSPWRSRNHARSSAAARAPAMAR